MLNLNANLPINSYEADVFLQWIESSSVSF